MASKVTVTRMAFSGCLNKIYPLGAQEWNVNWMNKTGDEKEISGIFKATSNGLRQQFHFLPLDIK